MEVEQKTQCPLTKNRDKLTKFKEVHKDKITQPIRCSVCRGSYTYFNKSAHIKTKRHQDFIEPNGV
jgi:hypothetical protein